MVFSTVFRSKFRPEVDSDVISGAIVDYVGVDVRGEFGSSRSNGSRDIRGIRGADCVTNKRTNMTEAYHIRHERLRGVLPKTLQLCRNVKPNERASKTGR